MKKRERTFIRVKTNTKTAHVQWGDYTLLPEDEQKARLIYKCGRYRVMLNDLFDKYQNHASKRSYLVHSVFFGCWDYCPLAAVPELLEILYSLLTAWSYMTRIRTIINPIEKKKLMLKIQKHKQTEGI